MRKRIKEKAELRQMFILGLLVKKVTEIVRKLQVQVFLSGSKGTNN